MKKIWIKSATAEDFAKAEIFDWFEGVGMITSHFDKDFIRRFGHHLTSQSSGQHKQEPIHICSECGLEHYSHMAAARCCR